MSERGRNPIAFFSVEFQNLYFKNGNAYKMFEIKKGNSF